MIKLEMDGWRGSWTIAGMDGLASSTDDEPQEH